MENRFIAEVKEFKLDDGTPFAETRAGAEILRLAKEQIDSDSSALEGESSITRNVLIGRRDDMNPNGRLVMLKQPDGDVCVSIVFDDRRASLEFCVPGTGGGRSPRTFHALNQLMLAMQADNCETPAIATQR